MKRIAGALAPLLLTGMWGCISFADTSPAGTKKTAGEVKATMVKTTPADLPLPPPNAGATTPVPLPSSPQWTQGGEAAVPPPPSRTGFVDHTAARPAAHATMSATSASGTRMTTPAPMPIAAHPSLQAPPAPMPLPAEMPSASTPRNESGIQQVNHVQPETMREPGTAIAVGKAAVNVPPMPNVKSSQPVEPRSTVGASVKGGPLFRLVNTKRITLNFEVKDVGSSGVASVELWFTQDGKDWKKHDAPAQAKAYVVEVDEEGMYGFTLLARSGTGLAKEPPQPGDTPQVWVIVDLTKPDVQLNDVSSSLQNNQQSVLLKWKASDKNLGRQPVSLSFAEKEEGPWKVIAAGLENTGSYNWEVPKGAPAKVLFRVEACDLAGNVGLAQLNKPVLMDNSVPTVLINSVDANGSR